MESRVKLIHTNNFNIMIEGGPEQTTPIGEITQELDMEKVHQEIERVKAEKELEAQRVVVGMMTLKLEDVVERMVRDPNVQAISQRVLELNS